MGPNYEQATLAGGCFWCMEELFKRIKGVISVVPGYSGGMVGNPSYEQVCTGKTGHAEAIHLLFDPEIITFSTILDIFWKIHDPQSLNKQGNDIGTQYRSAIFYQSDSQKQIAQESKKIHQKDFSKPIVTEIVPLSHFFPAEEYHKNFYTNNPNHPYCKIIIDPKLKKLMKEFKSKVKDNYA